MLDGVGVTGSYLLAVVTPEIEGSWGGKHFATPVKAHLHKSITAPSHQR